MLAKEQLDAVFISLPPGAQQEHVIDAARAGAAVFVTKPIALDLALTARTAEALRETGVVNQVGYMARYADVTDRVRTLIDGKTVAMGFGRFLCRMSPNHPWWGKRAISGGQITEQSTHVFDLLRYLIGEVEEVQAYGHTGSGSDIADFEDSTVVNLRFANGSIGSVVSTSCTRVEEGFVIELSGRDLYLKMTMDTGLSGQIGDDAIAYTGEETGYYRQVEQFIAAVRAGDQGLVRSSYADAARTLAVTRAADRSLELGRAVVVAEVAQ
jgi:predicted dehydrogenase